MYVCVMLLTLRLLVWWTSRTKSLRWTYNIYMSLCVFPSGLRDCIGLVCLALCFGASGPVWEFRFVLVLFGGSLRTAMIHLSKVL